MYVKLYVWEVFKMCYLIILFSNYMLCLLVACNGDQIPLTLVFND